MSPVGVPPKPENFNVETIANRQASRTAAFMFRRIHQLWDYNIGVFTILRKSGYYGANRMLRGFVNRRLRLESPEESEACKELLLQTNLRDISSEVCITMILGFGAFARIPLEPKLPDLTMPVCFLYGQWDWMSRASADKLMDAGKLKHGSMVSTIEKSGHHLYVENGEGCVGDVFKFVFGQNAKDAFLQEVNYFELMRKKEETI